MSKLPSTYPPDEFDAVSGDDVPAGVHRAPRSTWARVWPYIAVIVGCSVLAVGAVYYVYRDKAPTPSAGGETTTQAPSDEESATQAPAQELPSEEPTADEPPTEEPEEPTQDPSPSAETQPADTTIAVRVLNATGRNGIAAGAAADLEDEGWSDITADTYQGAALDDSVVYHKTADLEDEARAVAEVLGIDDVRLAPSLVGPVSAVLVGDYGR